MTRPWWMPSTPAAIQPVPWLCPEAVRRLESIVMPDMNVLEHGSGGSTIWFSRRARTVTAYENNKTWREKIAGAADNIFVYDGLPMVWFLYDLLLIDGEPVTDRAQWIAAAPSLIRSGGWVVLDNCNRPEYATERAELQRYAEHYETIDGNEGGTKYLMTEFYRMP